MSGLPMSAGNEPKGMYLTDVHLVVVSVAKDSPAHEQGLKSQDRIVYVRTMDDSLDAISPEGLQNFVAKHSTDVLEIGYVRGDKDIRDQNNISSVSLVPSIYDSSLSKPGIGIAMDEVGFVKLPFIQALTEGMKINVQVTKSTVGGLYKLIADAFKGEGDLSSVTGPVGMVGIVGDAYKFGFAYLLSFAALISVNLAIINLIPFPALDGGRLLFLLIEKIKGSRINPKIANTANIIGFTILILLMLFVTYRDILKLI
jgi:regulator of sigma E protease